MSNIPKLIFNKRKSLGENQVEFAKRFGMSGTATSLWESGNREAPYKVIEFCLQDNPERVLCPRCGGKGIINKFVGEVGEKQP